MLWDSQDRNQNRQQQAGWAHRSYCQVIAEIFANASKREVLERLHLCQQPLGDETGVQKQDASLFVTLLCNMASQRMWSMAYLSESQPHNWLGLLHDKVELVREALDKVHRDADIVRDAHRKMLEKSEGVDLEVLF